MGSFKTKVLIPFLLCTVLASVLLCLLPEAFLIWQKYSITRTETFNEDIDIPDRIMSETGISDLKCKRKSASEYSCLAIEESRSKAHLLLAKLQEKPKIGWLSRQFFVSDVEKKLKLVSELRQESSEVQAKIDLLGPKALEINPELNSLYKELMQLENGTLQAVKQKEMITNAIEEQDSSDRTALFENKKIALEKSLKDRELRIKEIKSIITEDPSPQAQLIRLQQKRSILGEKIDAHLQESENCQEHLASYSGQSLLPDPKDIQIEAKNSDLVIQRNMYNLLWLLPLSSFFFGLWIRIFNIELDDSSDDQSRTLSIEEIEEHLNLPFLGQV